MIDWQKHLIYITNLIVCRDLELPKLRAVKAKWREEDHTACISFYFDGAITEEEKEEASDICGGIIAHFPDGFLEENYIQWDYPKPLLESAFWAYKRDEQK
ncbi:hypothetical protein [Candidatus Protochlamydia phocaeensis]|uniref:hypothetical protein n=1 Tax=Candidatus Protochlamydia phocaeensis TaxID=1414722 RepID=UPI000838527D|nr:hypothetical protein [Candidatus Protochlamydia phocaeensis]